MKHLMVAVIIGVSLTACASNDRQLTDLADRVDQLEAQVDELTTKDADLEARLARAERNADSIRLSLSTTQADLAHLRECTLDPEAEPFDATISRGILPGELFVEPLSALPLSVRVDLSKCY